MIPLWLALVTLALSIIGLGFSPIIGILGAVVIGYYGYMAPAIIIGASSVVGWLVTLLLMHSNSY
jgi:hypothetical protein